MSNGFVLPGVSIQASLHMQKVAAKIPTLPKAPARMIPAPVIPKAGLGNLSKVVDPVPMPKPALSSVGGAGNSGSVLSKGLPKAPAVPPPLPTKPNFISRHRTPLALGVGATALGGGIGSYMTEEPTELGTYIRKKMESAAKKTDRAATSVGLTPNPTFLEDGLDDARRAYYYQNPVRDYLRPQNVSEGPTRRFQNIETGPMPRELEQGPVPRLFEGPQEIERGPVPRLFGDLEKRNSDILVQYMQKMAVNPAAMIAGGTKTIKSVGGTLDDAAKADLRAVGKLKLDPDGFSALYSGYPKTPVAPSATPVGNAGSPLSTTGLPKPTTVAPVKTPVAPTTPPPSPNMEMDAMKRQQALNQGTAYRPEFDTGRVPQQVSSAPSTTPITKTTEIPAAEMHRIYGDPRYKAPTQPAAPQVKSWPGRPPEGGVPTPTPAPTATPMATNPNLFQRGYQGTKNYAGRQLQNTKDFWNNRLNRAGRGVVIGGGLTGGASLAHNAIMGGPPNLERPHTDSVTLTGLDGNLENIKLEAGNQAGYAQAQAKVEELQKKFFDPKGDYAQALQSGNMEAAKRLLAKFEAADSNYGGSSWLSNRIPFTVRDRGIGHYRTQAAEYAKKMEEHFNMTRNLAKSTVDPIAPEIKALEAKIADPNTPHAERVRARVQLSTLSRVSENRAAPVDNSGPIADTIARTTFRDPRTGKAPAKPSGSPAPAPAPTTAATRPTLNVNSANLDKKLAATELELERLRTQLQGSQGQ